MPIDDTQVEVRVGRLKHKDISATPEMVNMADVGLGLSQTLPVLVALRVARPGQMVFLEQPEIHLHPLAQSGLAQVLANAANRGVRVVVETHSSLVLLGIQTIVAKGKLAADKVRLHWFSRDDLGRTDIKSTSLDESGAFGDWPEDFDAIALQAQSQYLDATESKQAGKSLARPN
jgi:predicted ATPase